jgi:small-conductance mechanosensitive channel
MAKPAPSWKCALLLLLAIQFAGTNISGQTSKRQLPGAKQKTAVSQPSPQPSPSPTPTPNLLVIPVAEIGKESIQLNQRLRTLPDRIATDASITESDQATNTLKAKIANNTRETEQAIQTEAVFIELQQISVDWESLQKEVGTLSDKLTKQITTLNNEINALKGDQSRWQATAVETKPDLPPETLELINKANADLAAALATTQERRVRTETLQHAVAEQGSIVTGEAEILKKAIAISQRTLLEVDSPPLWQIQFGSQPEDSLVRVLSRSYAGDLPRLKAFITAKRTALMVVGLVLIGHLVFLTRLSREIRRTTAEANSPKRDQIFLRPVSLSLLVGIVAMMPLLHAAPVSARSIVYFVGVVPVIRLLQPRLTRTYNRMLIAAIVSLLVWQVIIFLRLPIWIKRDLLEVFALLVVGGFVWLASHSKQDEPSKNRRGKATLVGVYLGVALLTIVLLANLFGYVGLADLLAQGTLVSAYRAVALYTIALAGSLLIYFGLNARVTQSLALFRNTAERLGRRLSLAFSFAMLLVWLDQTLNLFAVGPALYDTIGRALNYEFKFGSVSLTLNNLVAFLLTLFFGYLLAAGLRAILGEEILPRLNLARGLPNAVATITHYVLLILIFFLALAAGGVELSKFTILTGALGVGLGFGLQSVVNNFVSGLILLFERPVRIGDYLDVGGVSGEVTKIGFRSSTLHVFDGSDLIIPNGDLISQRVINWTLTGTRRQIILPIHVAYENNPNEVRDLLREAVASQADVLRYPIPIVLFLGFGDSALNFEIRFWAPRPEVVVELKSEVTLSIAAALSEAGIKVPVPRRELNITTDQIPKEMTAIANRD